MSFLHLISTEIAALGKAVRQGEKALAGKEEVVAVERTSQRQLKYVCPCTNLKVTQIQPTRRILSQHTNLLLIYEQ